jgi:hypothetical protein
MESFKNSNTFDIFYSCDNAPLDLLQEFIELYKPVSVINEKIELTKTYEDYPKHPHTNKNNMLCHFLNKSRVFYLLEKHIEIHKIHYDLVISLRLDLLFENTMPFYTVEEDTIYIPEGYDYLDFAINDQIAYGSIRTMKIYMNIINNLEIILNNNKTLLHPESLTYTNILNNGLKIIRFPFNYRLDK